jgi:hypothetical protein
MAKKKPAADAIQDNSAKPKKPRAKKAAKAIPELGIDGNASHEPMRTVNQEYAPKNQVGLGWFAGSLHEMTREEHIAKLRHFQEHGSFPSTTAGIPGTAEQATPSDTAPATDSENILCAKNSKRENNQDTEGNHKTLWIGLGNRQPEDNAAEGEATTTQTEPDTSAEMQGDVPVSVAEAGSTYTAKQLELVPLARVRNGETRGQCWERLRQEGRAAGMTRRGAIAYAGGVIDSLFPPPEPVIVEELPAAEPPDEPAMSTIVDIPEEPAIEAAPPAPAVDMGVKGLGEMPESWGTLPANAQLQVEIAWVSANRLRVRSGTGVDLSRALSPAPSYSALSWLETSILFPSKFADISVKATAQQDDEREGIRREKLAIEEIRGLLAEMLEG